jgi:hypothetical protein
MDRRGFNYAAGELSLETLREIAARGGRFWIAEAGALRSSGLLGAATRRFDQVDACASGYFLLDLGQTDE